MYLPLHNIIKQNYFIRISLSKLSLLTVSLPLIAFVFCLTITLYKDSERANKTHCNVPNIFPSISACTGNYEPQRTIWQSAVYLHAPLRFFIIYHRWKYFKRIVLADYVFLVNLAVLLNIIENLMLLGITYWTSNENYPYHEFCFKTFIGSSIFYMLFMCILLTKYRRRQNFTRSERYSVKLKWRAFIINTGSFAFAACFFLRHNKLCEPYVYSMFGFSEYLVVISNIGFHATTIYDLPREFIYITNTGVAVE